MLNREYGLGILFFSEAELVDIGLGEVLDEQPFSCNVAFEPNAEESDFVSCRVRGVTLEGIILIINYCPCFH